MMHSSGRTGLLLLLLAFTGCLPHSCRREESTALTPADSLSRQIALSIPADTLELTWISGGPTDAALEHPRTVRFGNGDTLFVGDVERNSIFLFTRGGRRVHELRPPGLDVPYIAGIRGDTLAVFNPGHLRVDFLAGGEIVRSLSIQDDVRTKHNLVYASVGERIFYKRVNGDAGGIIAEVGTDGVLARKHALVGPQWRLAGLLRTWGDSLLSLSGFRPVVDVIHVTDTAVQKLDTLALRGFDSPMLARSRSFMTGGTHQAPLLSAAAAPAGDRLFVLNLRAGWLQIDVFDRDGMLQNRLLQREQEYRRSYYPRDLDVRQPAPGTYEIAVVLSAPEPVVEVYRWESTSRSISSSRRALP